MESARTALAALLLASACGRLALAAEHRLTIRDTIGRAWEHEPITWELTLEPGEWRGGAFCLLRDGKPVVAQADVAAQHDDGSVKSAAIRFIVDALAKDASTTVALRFDQAGPKDTDLSVAEEKEAIVLANRLVAVRVVQRNVEKAEGGEFSPILGVRLPSGRWTASGHYATETAKPVGSKTELLGKGPVRLAARVTTTFENGRRHEVTVALWSGSRSVEIEEDFNLGPDDRYRFKEYANDRDELAWEWWSWYGDREGKTEGHPNNWLVPLSSAQFHPTRADYFGDMSTAPERGDTKQRGRSGYALAYGQPRRLEKYLAGHGQWRPDSALWYAASEAEDPGADCLGVYTHSVRTWRNPNVLPTPTGITLRTGANDMRLLSLAQDRTLLVQCPIGLGHRAWAIRPSTREESFGARGTSPTALTAEGVQRSMGLDITRTWVTDWAMTTDYPRLFIRPEERQAYYARFKESGAGFGWGLGGFLQKQDMDSFHKAWEQAVDQADKMIQGYVSHGMTISNSYPGWMLGYWHGIIVAAGVDNLVGSPFCTKEMVRELKKKLAILTYCLVSKDAWADKQINYGWGSMNMPVGRWGGLVVMASALSDHPMAKTWLKDATRYFNMLLETEYAPDGTHISCPHYIGASVTSFYAWIALANSGLGPDVSTSPVLRNFARYYMQLMKPVDPRWGIRILLNEGDTRPGSSPFPAILGTLFRKSDPELAGQLLRIWKEGGSPLSSGMGIPDAVIIDPTVEPRTPRLGPEVFPGFGAFLRFRELGTPQEAYLAFTAGNFMIDHANVDQMAFAWNEKGVPLSCYTGSMYQPMTNTALSHNTIAWDVRPEGGPCPGKDKPGCWHHDHHVAWAPHEKRPRLHIELGWDQTKQKITDSRGMVTFATDQPDAALIQGQVEVLTLTEVPTRADYSAIMMPHQQTPLVPVRKPFTWTRRLLYVKAAKAEGMNYLVVRDDFGAFDERTPHFNYWSLSEDVELGADTAHFVGQLGVNTDLFVAVPPKVALHKEAFTHDQCEGEVSSRHQQKFGQKFSEKQVLCRAEGQRGKGFLVVLFPRKLDEEKPILQRWQGDAGVKVSWKGETHFVLLDVDEREAEADGVRARASCLVVKARGPRDFSLALPAGGSASFGGQSVDGPGPVGLQVVDGQARKLAGTDLRKPR